MKKMSINKKLTAFVLSAVIALSGNALTAFANNAADDIISVATEEIGYKEKNGYNKYGEITGYPNSAWCASFVSWCAAQAEVPKTTINALHHAKIWFRFSKAKTDFTDLLHTGALYSTKRRFSVLYLEKDGNVNHVGLVEHVTGNTLFTIEGNTSQKVARRSYNLASGYLLGYGNPNYASSKIFDGTYIIRPVYSDKVIETAGGSIADNYYEGWQYNVALWTDYHFTDLNQCWELELMYDNIYKIKNVLLNQYLVMDDSNLNDESPNVSVHENGEAPFALWKVIPNEGGSFCLVNVSTGKALDVLGASDELSSNVCGYKYDANDIAEMFYIIKV